VNRKEHPAATRAKAAAKRARTIQKVRDRCDTVPARTPDDAEPDQPRPAAKFPERRQEQV
jgi:hypothetical protein